jgi:hypothetical protein
MEAASGGESNAEEIKIDRSVAGAQKSAADGPRAGSLSTWGGSPKRTRFCQGFSKFVIAIGEILSFRRNWHLKWSSGRSYAQQGQKDLVPFSLAAESGKLMN